MKYIFVAGGVMSGVGKGVAAASIGKLLQSRGLKVTAIKIDPYVNVDAGTMNPTEHGEVFVLKDGNECDQDMGNYERFLEQDLTRDNYMTTGSVYLSVIQKERNLEYKGKCVEVVPQIPLEIIDRIDRAGKKAGAQVVIVEIGGTVGEYQNILFLEAVRMLKIKKTKDTFLVLVSFLPTVAAGGTELKTKPTQYAVRTLNSAGLQPDMILARAPVPLDAKRKQTIALNCNIEERCIISAPNVESIYDVPLNFERDGMSDILLKKIGLRARGRDMKDWEEMAKRSRLTSPSVKIGIVGKYFGSGGFVLSDSYISVIESVRHAAAREGVHADIEWLDSEEYEKDPASLAHLSRLSGVVIPGGFGSRGVEGKIAAIRYAREHKIPYFGLCYGMQLAVVEYARHKAALTGAHTTEVNAKTPHSVIDIMSEQTANVKEKKYGGTMRLGEYPALLKQGSVARGAYGADVVRERHRHRYEVNPLYRSRIEDAGGVFSGTSPEGKLMEIFELPHAVHPFFVGTQFHPEFTSRPLAPHPLFLAFIKAAKKRGFE